MLTWLDGKLPYEQATEILEELGGVTVSVSSNWRIGQESGQAIRGVLAAEEQKMKEQAREWSTPGGPANPKARMGISMDGAMMHIRDEDWKEFKIAAVGRIEQREERDVLTGDIANYGHIVDLSYTAYLGGPDVFGWRVWTEAQRRGWNQASDSVVLGDGAVWIWNQKTEHFHDSVGIVDWYHAVENLTEAQHARYPEDGPASSRWFNSLRQELYLGHARNVAQRLETTAELMADTEARDTLRSKAGYFRNNRDRMQYQDFRIEGWPIGSGTIESTAKQFKARVSGPGMRWSRDGAHNILAICSVALTSRERFDQVWSQAYSLPPN